MGENNETTLELNKSPEDREWLRRRLELALEVVRDGNPNWPHLNNGSTVCLYCGYNAPSHMSGCKAAIILGVSL